MKGILYFEKCIHLYHLLGSLSQGSYIPFNVGKVSIMHPILKRIKLRLIVVYWCIECDTAGEGQSWNSVKIFGPLCFQK